MTKVSKLVTHIISNSDSLDNVGLYYGKTGISLALFEASRYLRNEVVEDKAFDILQQSLIFKDQNYSFENGLSGVGYVLCYLINNRFIEADFDEIFGKQFENIISNFEDIDKNPHKLLNTLNVVYFLCEINKLKQTDERLPRIIKFFFEGLELFLIVQFHDFFDPCYLNNKMKVFKIFEIYLKLVNYVDYKFFSRVVLESYSDLYQKGITVNSIGIGFYLGMLVRKYSLTNYDKVVNDHIIKGIENIRKDILSLKEKIDCMKLLFDIESNRIIPLPVINIDLLHEDININSYPLHYKGGLARFLLFLVNKQSVFL
ncbi:lanthionine synthetase LanC family protein [Clostridium tyrobutyricum]|uniref:lanthionine synthetase LanC family protein n=1 Tax=Clostridium tyrobutyricum TaxID=1519 RepID=UPI002B1F3787|nr:lanthionine synthetase LanC family protein [Clostridium tyrobutyricum]MEA5009485.1 lanthionine synthetase LanC family protein [Clostridium tyrobutyricum]